MKTTSALITFITVALAFCSSASFAQKSQANERNEKVVIQVYAAYEKKDWHMLEEVFADGFTFTSPAGDDHINMRCTRKGAGPMLTISRSSSSTKL